jgi:hypothetical protein
VIVTTLDPDIFTVSGVLVDRNPTPEGYAEPLRLRDGDVVAPLFAPCVTIAVADLLPRPRPEPQTR